MSLSIYKYLKWNICECQHLNMLFLCSDSQLSPIASEPKKQKCALNLQHLSHLIVVSSDFNHMDKNLKHRLHGSTELQWADLNTQLQMTCLLEIMSTVNVRTTFTVLPIITHTLFSFIQLCSIGEATKCGIAQ